MARETQNGSRRLSRPTMQFLLLPDSWINGGSVKVFLVTINWLAGNGNCSVVRVGRYYAHLPEDKKGGLRVSESMVHDIEFQEILYIRRSLGSIHQASADWFMGFILLNAERRWIVMGSALNSCPQQSRSKLIAHFWCFVAPDRLKYKTIQAIIILLISLWFLFAPNIIAWVKVRYLVRTPFEYLGTLCSLPTAKTTVRTRTSKRRIVQEGGGSYRDL